VDSRADCDQLNLAHKTKQTNLVQYISVKADWKESEDYGGKHWK